ncbi:MAG: hypothetical protein IPG48_18220 [Saprospiraceae bacterium]|nr:hypothetical protein [Saprospiraceae bacterium]
MTIFPAKSKTETEQSLSSSTPVIVNFPRKNKKKKKKRKFLKKKRGGEEKKKEKEKGGV